MLILQYPPVFSILPRKPDVFGVSFCRQYGTFLWRTACTSARFVSGICVFVDPDLVFSDNPVNLNFRWVGYLDPAWRWCRNMERIKNPVSGRPAALSRDDRLRCHDDRLHAGWTAHFRAMKTVVMGIFCASRGKYLRKCLLPLLEKPFGKVVLTAFFLFLWAFFTIFPGCPDIFTGSASGRFL